MDLYDNNTNKSAGKKKVVLVGIIICIVLIVIFGILIMFYENVDSTTFRVYVDGVSTSYSSDFLYQDESGNVYVKAKELATMIGWAYENGEYGSYEESTDSGYIQGEYEVASFVVDSTELKKYIYFSESETESDSESSDDDDDTEETDSLEISVVSENGTLEITELDLPIISVDDQIYFPFESLNDICNCMCSYEGYTMQIYELDYLIELALSYAGSYGYETISGSYENLRALAYGMMVVANTSGMYGVVSLSSNEQILGFKYTDMTFYQNVKEFFVKADDTVGIVSYEGTVIISPKNYDDISIISNSLGLYLIGKDGMYGVLNREGETIVPVEYDSIGLSEKDVYVFEYTSEDNKYLLYDNTIIVEKDDKYGLYDLEGNNTLSVNFEGIGYVSSIDEESYKKSTSSTTSSTSSSSSSSSTGSSSSTSGDSVLTINVNITLEDETTVEVQGIVVEQTNLSGETVYGVYDAMQNKLIIPCGCTRIYSTTKSGVTTYYMEYDGEQLEFENYIIQQELYYQE